MGKRKIVIWDWNGTLINDVDASIFVMNSMLAERGLPVMKSRADYHEVFGFPVFEYYKRLGLDFEREPFEILAKVFIEGFQDKILESSLFPEVPKVLERFRKNGVSQIIISASKMEHLLEQVGNYPIGHFFDHIYGLDDYYAKSKIDVGKRFALQNGISGSDMLVIGDTCHDFELARELNCRCVLVANGHQSRKVLSGCCCEIIDSLSEISMLL